jgi:hypothetical protein
MHPARNTSLPVAEPHGYFDDRERPPRVFRSDIARQSGQRAVPPIRLRWELITEAEPDRIVAPPCDNEPEVAESWL